MKNGIRVCLYEEKENKKIDLTKLDMMIVEYMAFYEKVKKVEKLFVVSFMEKSQNSFGPDIPPFFPVLKNHKTDIECLLVILSIACDCI